jgi:hypothetical protein
MIKNAISRMAAILPLSPVYSARAEIPSGPVRVFPDLTGVATVSLQPGTGDPVGNAASIPCGR